ncbi:ATP-binding protein [Streptosporangium sp. G12]
MVRVLQPGSASRRARAILREVLQESGLGDDAISDAELVVAELAANAEKHAHPPYELRIISVNAVPTWCEIADGDPDLHEVGIIFDLLHSVDELGLPLLAENGRGLLLAHQLSRGHCHVYATTTFTTGAPAKAVTFALPTRPDNQCTFLPLPDLGAGLASLSRWADQHPSS